MIGMRKEVEAFGLNSARPAPTGGRFTPPLVSGAARLCLTFVTTSVCFLTQYGHADTNQRMDQFHVVAIPQGVTLERACPNSPTREFTYKTGTLTQLELEKFSKALCRSDNSTVEKLRPSWRQRIARIIPVRATC